MSLCVSYWIYPIWVSLGFLNLGDYFLLHFREVFDYYLLKYFFTPSSLVYFFWDAYDSNFGSFNIVPVVSGAVPLSLNYFILSPICFIYFHHFIFHLTCLSSASDTLLSVPSRVFLISAIALFIIDWLFFIFLTPCYTFFATSLSMFLVYLSVSPFCFQVLDLLYYHYFRFFFR